MATIMPRTRLNEHREESRKGQSNASRIFRTFLQSSLTLEIEKRFYECVSTSNLVLRALCPTYPVKHWHEEKVARSGDT